MFNGGCEILQTPVSVQSIEDAHRAKQSAYVKIIEQPAPKTLRFRYECEGRSAGSIPGVSSTPENKTFPTIKVVGYQGRAVVVVSCVTKDEPYRPHPHNLVGREGCKRGVCTLTIPQETMTLQFSNLGIQCVKKKDIDAALLAREEIRVDPFRTGFSHRGASTTIDLNAVRLCFQVFLEGERRGKFTVSLPPVVSEPIYDKKAMSELTIVKMSDCVSYVDGNRKEILLFCEKIAKDDIQIRFFEEQDGVVVWEDIADLQPSQVHKQVAMAFRPPRYRNIDVTEPVRAFIQLRRPSDGATSRALPFEFLPICERKRKRAKLDSLLTLSQEMGLTGDPPFMNIKVEPSENAYPWPQGGIISVPDDGQVLQPDTNPFRTPNIQNMPSTSNVMQPLSSQTWNLPYIQPGASNSTAPGNMDGIHILMDMDSHNTELKQLNSEDLGSLDAVLNLSETLNSNLYLGDIQERPDLNMTDSLTRLANNALDSLCQGTNAFK